MSVRNHNWYGLQATRRYPLDDNSTGLDDSDNLIRDDILVDCHIRFPNTYGKYVYVQGITVAPGIVTVVFGVSNQVGFVRGEPLAAVTVPRPIAANVNYAVTGLQPGVSGWVVFGPGIDTGFIGRYSTVQQTLVSPRCARAYRPLPVPTIGKIGLASSLQGVVRLLGAAPVKVRYVQDAGRVVRMVDGEKTVHLDTVPALVIELDLDQQTATYNPLKEFLGPCATRPESGTCPKPPIESVNGITPDEDGNINIVFENFAQVVPFDDCGGLVIRHDKDLPVICNQTNEPRKTYNNDCCNAALEVATEADLQAIPAENRTAYMIVTATDTNERWKLAQDLVTWQPTTDEYGCLFPDPTTLIPDIIIDETGGGGALAFRAGPAYGELPLCLDFSDASACDGYDKFTQQTGRFELVQGPRPSGCPSCDPAQLKTETVNNSVYAPANAIGPRYVAKTAVGLNIATLTGTPTDWAVGKTVTVELAIGSTGSGKNGGIVLNYQTTKNAAQQPQTTFVAIVLDAALGQLRVLRYTNSFVTVEAAVPFLIDTEPCVGCSPWYRLSTSTIAAGDNVALTARVEKITNAAAPDSKSASVTLQLNRGAYGEFVGEHGFISNGSITSFNKLTITDQ